tara:strand:+ start:527 stop:1102 length:576 start_codon:yes stop_codon:yes gene_type:complete
MIKMREQTEPGKTPEKITVSMIDQDLKNGIGKAEMSVKYGIKPWEVDRMFEHPFLKGRRPSKKKPLSFIFEDDSLPLNSGDIAVEQAEDLPNSGRQFVTDDEDSIDPNQVTLEQAIDSAIESAEEAKDALAEAVKTVDEIFPTEITGIPNGDTISDTDDEDLDLPTFEDTMDLVKEQQEEELEEEDDTFEL